MLYPSFVLALATSTAHGLSISSPQLRTSAKAPARAAGAAMEAKYPRVVVTGMGIISCLGTTLDDVKDSLFETKSGLTFCQEFADVGMKSQVSGQPMLDMDAMIERKKMRFMGMNAKHAFVAMERCIEDAGMAPEVYEGNKRAGSILGQADTSGTDIQAVTDAVDGQKRIHSKIGPYRVTRTMGSSVSAVLSTQFKLQGASFAISSACSTGAHCIGTGMELIQLGKLDMCFCGAGECGGYRSAVMFDAMGALSTSYNDEPTKASRAMDKGRDGFVFGGGGGIVLIEELEHAKARGAKIYGELTGYGATADGYDMVAPSGEGGERAMAMAMEMADEIGGSKPVDYINTHGTSTPVGDTMELKAIKSRFSEAGYQPYVGSTKSLTGHALGAAGVHEAIYSLIMLNNNFLAESANIEDVVDEADGMKVLSKRYDGDVQRVMSNSFGFGGTNCCLVFDKYTE